MRYGWATCLPHKGGDVPLSALRKDTTSELASLFFTLSLFFQALIFQPLPFPLSLTKSEKTTADNFLNFCGCVASPLLDFIILRGKNLHLLLLLYLLRLSLLFGTTLRFFFLDIRTRVECRLVLFNLSVIAEPLMYFRVCHGTPY